VPRKLHNAGKAPSYKAIAVAILKNDMNLYSLGFGRRDSVILDCVIESEKEKKRKAERPRDLFLDYAEWI
jgi:predicted phosphoadenosine phosphosulfate sulfurtransferase